jgi:hypothetical protein
LQRAGRPDWTNFLLLGGCFLWAVLLKITEVHSPHFCAIFLSLDGVLILTKNVLATFWFFSHTRLVTLATSLKRTH